MSKGVPLKCYVDALNAERSRVQNWRATAIVGTLGALIFGIFRATGVLAATFETRFQGTNEWRGTLEDQNKEKATISEVKQLKEQMEKLEGLINEKVNKTAGGKQLAIMAMLIIGSVAAINGIIFVIQGAVH